MAVPSSFPPPLKMVFHRVKPLFKLRVSTKKQIFLPTLMSPVCLPRENHALAVMIPSIFSKISHQGVVGSAHETFLSLVDLLMSF